MMPIFITENGRGVVTPLLRDINRLSSCCQWVSSQLLAMTFPISHVPVSVFSQLTGSRLLYYRTMHFNPNSPILRFLDTLWRFIALNVVFVLTCIPLVTLGPSVAALFSTIFAYNDHEDIPLVREFFRRWVREWKYALFGGLIFLAVGALIAFGLAFWVQMPVPGSYIALVIILFFAAFEIITMEWFFPLQVRYDNKWGQLWKLALGIGWQQQKTSLALLAIDIAVITLAYFSKIFLVLFLVFGFSWVVYAKTLILLAAFRRVEHPEEKPTYINAVQ